MQKSDNYGKNYGAKFHHYLKELLCFLHYFTVTYGAEIPVKQTKDQVI